MSGDLQPGVMYRHLRDGQVLLEGDRPAEHWALELMAGFTRLQFTIESQLTAYLHQHSPHVADVLEKKYISRLTDDERWLYVKAMGKDVGYQGNLQPAGDAFWRCKRVRDVIGHSTSFQPLYDPTIQAFRYPIDRNHHKKGVPDPLTPAVLRNLAMECRWLEAVVTHLGYLGGVRSMSVGGHQHEDGTVHWPLLEIPEPGPLPTDPAWQAAPAQLRPCDAGGLRTSSSKVPSVDKTTGHRPAGALSEQAQRRCWLLPPPSRCQHHDGDADSQDDPIPAPKRH